MDYCRLLLASQGKTQSTGGLNIPEILSVLTSAGIKADKNTKRGTLDALLTAYIKTLPSKPCGLGAPKTALHKAAPPKPVAPVAPVAPAAFVAPKAPAPAQKNVILMLQSDADHNGAFDFGDPGLQKLLAGLNEFPVIHRMVHGSLDGLRTTLADTLQSRKIAHLVIMAHGAPNLFLLSRECTVGEDNIGQFADILRPHLERDSTIFMHCCSTGQGDQSIASMLATYLPGHLVFAANQTISRGDLLVLLAEPRGKILDIFYEVDTERVLSSGRPEYEMRTFMVQAGGQRGKRALERRIRSIYRV